MLEIKLTDYSYGTLYIITIAHPDNIIVGIFLKRFSLQLTIPRDLARQGFINFLTSAVKNHHHSVIKKFMLGQLPYIINSIVVGSKKTRNRRWRNFGRSYGGYD